MDVHTFFQNCYLLQMMGCYLLYIYDVFVFVTQDQLAKELNAIKDSANPADQVSSCFKNWFCALQVTDMHCVHIVVFTLHCA